jgi:hypothetical protein
MDHETSTLARWQPAFAALRRFARRRPAAERCELCACEILADHEHLIEPASRRLLCSCTACALLFSGQESARHRRVPRRAQLLRDFRMTDAQWDDLLIPINLAFFFRSSVSGRVVAAYPSPAGATESLLTLEAWEQLEAENPVLRELAPDVEALLLNRVGQARVSYRVSIDECYRLVGLIRRNWRGLSGGTEAWDAINQFFSELNDRSSQAGGRSDA